MTVSSCKFVLVNGSGFAVVLICVLLAFSALPAYAQDAKFNSDNSLTRPEGYRDWMYVGTPLTPNDLNNGEAPFPEFHNVYINPDAWRVYQRTGRFPDGTVLVKELVSVGAKEASSGAGYFMGEFVGLEAAVKDSKRFPNEPGYWAYFSFGHSYPLAESTQAQAVENCSSCHQVQAAQDFVFTQYYPIIRAAESAGKSGGGRMRPLESR